MFSRKTEKVINLKSVAIAFACLFLILNEISEMSQIFDSDKRVGYGWKPPGLISNSKEPLSHNKKRSILVGIHTMCVCVRWQNLTDLLLQFNFQFLTTLGIWTVVSTRKKTVRHAHRPGESEKGDLGGRFLLWMNCLQFTLKPDYSLSALRNCNVNYFCPIC